MTKQKTKLKNVDSTLDVMATAELAEEVEKELKKKEKPNLSIAELIELAKDC